MRAELLKVLDKAYDTDLFTLSDNPEGVSPAQCKEILAKCLSQKPHQQNTPCTIPSSQMEELRQIIVLGEQIIEEKSSLNIEKFVDIFLKNKFGMEYPYPLPVVPACSLKEIFIFHYLSRCKVWPTICKQLNKSRDKEYKLRCLIEWYVDFVKRMGIKDMFEPDALSKKDLKTVTKKKLINAANSDLIDAVTKSDYEKVEQLLSQGVDVESITPLKERQEVVTRLRASHVACDNGDLKMCKILTKFKADWQAEDSQKMSPIFYAIKSGSMEVLQYLIQQLKVNIEKREIQKRTSFYWACTQGDMALIKYLYGRGADINNASEIGRTALSKACFLGRRDIVQFLLNCKDIKMNCKDKKGRTPLHNAVFGPKGGRQAHKFGTFDKDSPQCAILLLERGVDANETDNDFNTGLHVALSSAALDSVPVLIAYGGNIAQRNRFQQTPIMVGCKFGHSDAVKILVENYNDDLTTKDFVGCNSLVLVAKNLKGSKGEVHPLFNYILPKYIDQIMKKQNYLQDIFDTFQRLIGLKTSKQLLTFFHYIQERKIPLRIDVHSIIKCIQGLDQEVPLTLLSAQIRKEADIVHIIKHVVKARKMILLESILTMYNKQLNHTVFPIDFLQQTVDVNDKLITQVITLLNINIIQEKLEGRKNILHFLVENRKMGTLIQLLKLYTDSYHSSIKNKFLLKPKGQLKNVLRQQLSQIDGQNGMTCAQIALIRKYFDILKILENYIQQHMDKQHSLHALQHFKIQEYVVVKQTNEEELQRFKGHEKAEELNTLIEKCSTMKQQHLLDQINCLNKDQQLLRNEIFHVDDKVINKFYRLLKEKRQTYLCQTQQELIDSVNTIGDSSILAIDLEYSTESANISIICTLQLSCVYRDIVVDCLRIPFHAIRKHLQSFMHNPYITKVLHGCDRDLILLKSNFNISLVNTMDTARIQMLLTDKTEMTGLKNLAEKYLDGLQMNKEYQTSEWRLRPLPKAMLEYARSDSLNLLLIYFKILKAIPMSKVTDIVVSNLKVALKNTKPGIELIKQIKPAKVISDN